MTQDGCRQVGIGRIGVGTVMVVTALVSSAINLDTRHIPSSMRMEMQSELPREGSSNTVSPSMMVPSKSDMVPSVKYLISRQDERSWK